MNVKERVRKNMSVQLYAPLHKINRHSRKLHLLHYVSELTKDHTVSASYLKVSLKFP